MEAGNCSFCRGSMDGYKSFWRVRAIAAEQLGGTDAARVASGYAPSGCRTTQTLAVRIKYRGNTKK